MPTVVVPGCHFDFLATHLYTCNAQQLRLYLNDCKRYGMPLWVTEFSCPNGRDGPLQQQASFMKDAVRMMDADADVERCTLVVINTHLRMQSM